LSHRRLLINRSALLCDQPLLEGGERREVFGSTRSFFGSDDVRQRGDRCLIASYIYSDGSAHQVLVAVGPARLETDVELTELAGEVPHTDLDG
jgi:hypothetical protein